MQLSMILYTSICSQHGFVMENHVSCLRLSFYFEKITMAINEEGWLMLAMWTLSRPLTRSHMVSNPIVPKIGLVAGGRG